MANAGNVSNVISEENIRNVVRNYKDSVFRMLFQEKKELLVLYNAVNGTDYSNSEDLQITTLESAVYMSMKNDVSFVLDMRLNLYEHQSTVNKNMPLRDLMYVAKIFEELVIHKDLYARTMIKLPSPHFITLYNGVEKQPERKIFRLSDAYEVKEEQPGLELVVTQLNINAGYNKELMEKCPILKEYMIYTEKIREYGKEMTLEESVSKAVEECIQEGILREFLLMNKSKVVSMSIFEFDQELHNRTLYEEGHEDGFVKGEASGFTKGKASGLAKGENKKLISQVCRKLKKGKTPAQIADDLEEEISLIQKICESAESFAPEYDVEKIYDAMTSKDN